MSLVARARCASGHEKRPNILPQSENIPFRTRPKVNGPPKPSWRDLEQISTSEQPAFLQFAQVDDSRVYRTVSFRAVPRIKKQWSVRSHAFRTAAVSVIDD
jgi:hypothetical protein